MFKKSDLFFFAVVFGGLAVLFLAGAVFAHPIANSLAQDNFLFSEGGASQQGVFVFRCLALTGCLISAALGWISYRHSRMVGD